jgi:hypothetical protein
VRDPSSRRRPTALSPARSSLPSGIFALRGLRRLSRARPKWAVGATLPPLPPLMSRMLGQCAVARLSALGSAASIPWSR